MAVAWLAACGPPDRMETAGPPLLTLDADQVIVGMDHFMTREGLRRAHLLADTAYFLSDSPLIRLRPVDVTFFDADGQEISRLTAAEGRYDTRSNDMQASGHVVVVDRRQNRRLETERLNYVAAEDRLRSDVAFTFYTGKQILRGRGFVSDPNLDTVRVVQPSGVADTVLSPR